MAIKTFAFGAVEPRTQADRDMFDQEVGRMHRLYNSLIEVVRTRRRETDEALAEAVPGLAQAEAEVVRIRAEVAELVNRVQGYRQQARSRAAHHVPAELRAQLAEARRCLTEANRACRDLRRTGFADGSRGREMVNAVNERARLQANERCQASGVYWPNKSTVRESVKQADKMSRGELPDFKRGFRQELGLYTGADRHLTVGETNVRADPENGRSQSGCTLDELMNGGSEYVQVQFDTDPPPRRDQNTPLPWFPSGVPRRWQPSGGFPNWTPGGRRDRRKRRVLVRLRVGSDERRRPIWFTIPATIDNWDRFPRDALVRQVLVTRRRVGLDLIWGVRFVVWYQGEEKTPHLDERCVGIDVGWRLLDSGDLRVAYWWGRDGRSGQWVIPASELGRFDEGDRLQAEIDARFNEYRARLVEWRDAEQPGGVLGEFLQYAGAWKAAGRSYQLHWLFEQHDLYPGHPIRVATADMAAFWERRYSHKCHGFEYHSNWRKNHYYCLVRDLKAMGYTTAVIENIHWPEFYQRPDAADDSPVLRGPRKYMRIAVPGLLHRIISSKFDSCLRVSPEYTTLACHACGRVDEFWDPATELTHTCRHCQAEWDQDYNAGVNLVSLAVAEAAGPVPEGDEADGPPNEIRRRQFRRPAGPPARG